MIKYAKEKYDVVEPNIRNCNVWDVNNLGLNIKAKCLVGNIETLPAAPSLVCPNVVICRQYFGSAASRFKGIGAIPRANIENASARKRDGIKKYPLFCPNCFERLISGRD